jgi:pre-60S factor REI1
MVELDEEIEDYYEFDNEDLDQDAGEWEDMSDAEPLSGEEEFNGEDDTELVLKSGKRIGSRQYNRYWKQNLKSTEIVPGSIKDPKMSNSTQIGFRNRGELITREQRLIFKEKHKQSKMEMRARQDLNARVGQKHNMLQHYYREQNPM